MARTNFERLAVYQLSERLDDEVWDNRRFVRMARGSLNETQHWLRRAYKRKLITQKETEILKPIIDELAPRLNAYLKSIGKTPKSIDN